MATPLDDGSWEIQGRRLVFPVRIGAASAACATYLVRSAPARELLAGIRLGRSASVVLGSGHPMADELRALRLPRRRWPP